MCLDINETTKSTHRSNKTFCFTQKLKLFHFPKRLIAETLNYFLCNNKLLNYSTPNFQNKSLFKKKKLK